MFLPVYHTYPVDVKRGRSAWKQPRLGLGWLSASTLASTRGVEGEVTLGEHRRAIAGTENDLALRARTEFERELAGNGVVRAWPLLAGRLVGISDMRQVQRLHLGSAHVVDQNTTLVSIAVPCQRVESDGGMINDMFDVAFASLRGPLRHLDQRLVRRDVESHELLRIGRVDRRDQKQQSEERGEPEKRFIHD